MNGVIIIPAYNPDEELALLAKAMCDMENIVIVVDDGSREENKEYFDRLDEEVILLRHENNRGKGAAIKTALAFIKEHLRDKDIIGIMDADGQHSPTNMETVLLAARRNPSSLVLGVREVGGKMPLRSRIGNTITRSVFHMVSGVPISDTQTGLRAFGMSLLDEMLAIEGERYEYETNVLLKMAKSGVPIREVKIETIYRDRKNSTSHFHVVRDSFRIYRTFLKFAFSSISSFVLDYGLFSLMMLALPHTAAMILVGNVLARMISAFYNYSVNCRFVFRKKRDFSTAMDYFFLACGILILNAGILEGLTQVAGMPVYAAKLLTELCLFAVSFLVQKRLIFKKNQDGRNFCRGKNKETVLMIRREMM